MIMANFPTKGGKLYPSFRRDVIDVCSDIFPHCVLDFPFRTKGKRKDDLITLSLDTQGTPGNVTYYEHPMNRDSDEGFDDDDDFNKWCTLVLHSLKAPTSCIPADVTGNGLHDLIVTYDYGDSLDSPDVFGGRICWIENYGTDEDDWAYHDIGRFPGVNIVKVGHFTTTYSLQVLAVVKSTNPDINAPLVVFTKPDDVYRPQKWHVNIVLDPKFSAIQDVLIVKSPNSGLDYVVISCQEGLFVAWYAERTWHSRPLLPLLSPATQGVGQIRKLRRKKDLVAYIVAAEDRSILSLYSKTQETSRSTAFPDIVWSRSVLMHFNDDGLNGTIVDLTCADFDGDGMDEILVSVTSQGSRHGIYYFDWEDAQFVRYRISPNAAFRITAGHFDKRNRLDFATLSLSLPREVSVHYNFFSPSQIRPFIEVNELAFSVPRLSSSICEADIIDVAGFILSLVLLPPDASYQVSSDGTDAVKVLYGSLGWIDSCDRLMERTRASGKPGCATSMLVDCHEGTVRSGSDGAVFVRLRPSKATSASFLLALNVLPSYFPCDVCEFTFLWEYAHDKPWLARSKSNNGMEQINHLNGFRVKFEGESTDFAHVHFWASEGNASTGFTNQVPTPWTHSGISDREICSIRACLSNPGGDGGYEYCDGHLDWGTTLPTKHQLSRAKKTILPVLHEQGPLWRSWVDEASDEVRIEYPWHTWVGRRGKTRGRRDVWVAFDFPPFSPPQTRYLDNRSCIIS